MRLQELARLLRLGNRLSATRLVRWLGWAWICGEELQRKWDTCYLFWQRNCWWRGSGPGSVGAQEGRQLVIIVMMRVVMRVVMSIPTTASGDARVLLNVATSASQYHNIRREQLLQQFAIWHQFYRMWRIKSRSLLDSRTTGFLPFVPLNLNLIESAPSLIKSFQYKWYPHWWTNHFIKSNIFYGTQIFIARHINSSISTEVSFCLSRSCLDLLWWSRRCKIRYQIPTKYFDPGTAGLDWI